MTTAAERAIRRTAPRAGGGRPPLVDVLLAGTLAALTFAVHDVGYLLRLPFWTDEAWVAISTRLPLSKLLRVVGSTPVGWALLLRLVPDTGGQQMRLIPLAFAALTVLAAYGWARILPWPSLLAARSAAVLAGVSALLLPSALARDDLKQYTADAFVTLLLLLAATRLENDWSRPRLIGLGALVVGTFLFSAVAAFGGAAVFGGLLLASLQRRRWTAARDLAVAGLLTGALLAVLFLVLYRPGAPPGLHAYWSSYYIPVADGPGPSWRFVVRGLDSMTGYLGMGPLWLAGLLVAAGVVTMFRLARGGVALVVPLLFLEMGVLSALGQYPLFDLRTSHFLTTALAVCGAIGAAGLCAMLARLHPAVGLAAALVLAAVFAIGARGGIRAEVINKPSNTVEDLRTPISALAARLRPADVVVVNMHSSWGFAYYWPVGSPAIEPVTSNLQEFIAVLPGQPRILVATDRSQAAVDDVMARAAALAGPGARIWFVHQHTVPAEIGYYAAAAGAHGWRDSPVVPGLDLWLPAG